MPERVYSLEYTQSVTFDKLLFGVLTYLFVVTGERLSIREPLAFRACILGGQQHRGSTHVGDLWLLLLLCGVHIMGYSTVSSIRVNVPAVFAGCCTLLL